MKVGKISDAQKFLNFKVKRWGRGF